MEMLQNMAQVKLTAVHYRGASQALVDMHGGHIDMVFSAPAPSPTNTAPAR